MNGFGIPAGMGGSGGSLGYYPNAMPSPLSPLPEPATPIYTGTRPTIYATDTAALVPSYPVYDPLGILNEPASPPVVMPPLPVLTTVIEPVEPGKFGGYAEQPTVYETSYPISAQQPPAGPVEWFIDAAGNVVKLAGDVVTTGVDAVVDAVKFIGEHLEVGVKYAGDIGGTAAKYKTAEAQLKAAEAARTLAKAQLIAAQPGLSLGTSTWLPEQLSDLLRRGLFGAPAPATPPLIEPGLVQEAPATNWPLLGLLAVGAYLLLKR